MITKIKQIKQIGTFSDYSGNALEFTKVNFIYGLNTYGKTTICDIFKSLGSQDPSYILKRKTIPVDSRNSQLAVIVHKKNQESSESMITFNRDSWIPFSIDNIICTFDTEFVHDNIFDGTSLLETRETRIRFTDFILGSEGVSIAKDLEEKKRLLRDKRAELPSILPSIVVGKRPDEIDAFMCLVVAESETELVSSISKNRSRKDGIDLQIAQKSSLLGLPEPEDIIEIDNDKIMATIENYKEVFHRTYGKMSEGISKRLAAHIESCLNNAKEAEKWIKLGYQYSKNGNCPYCGQTLENASELINAYSEYFNKEYSAFCEAIESEISQLVKDMIISTTLSSNIKSSIITFKDYQKYLVASDYGTMIAKLDEINDKAIKLENIIHVELKKTLELLSKISKEKMLKPYGSIDIDFASILECITEYQKLYSFALSTQKEWKKLIFDYKEKLKSDTLEKESLVLQGEIKSAEMKLERKKSNESCVKYEKTKEEISGLEREAKELSEHLDTEETDYLDKYFEKINQYFTSLGSRDYLIERSIPSNRGDKKTYGISVKYKGVSIANSDLISVFSESDRRALALSIYWAKLAMSPAEELEKCIVVLDDPVTSFDDNRILKINELISDFSRKVEQVFAFGHYPEFIRNYYLRNRISEEYSNYEIIKEDDLFSIRKLDIELFCADEMNKAFDEIYQFINGRNNIDIRTKMRNFFENRLNQLFYKQYLEGSVLNKGLEVRIDYLFEKKIISESTRDKLHSYRSSLNTESHIFTGNNIEDIRSYSDEIFSYLYNFEIKERAI